MVSESLKHQNIAIVGAFDFQPGNDLEKVGIKGGYSITLLGSNTSREKKGEKSLTVGGFCLLVKRDKIEHLLDEDYFLYFEETKLCWECNAKGYDVIIPKKCKLWHYGSVTTGKNSPLKTHYSERNRIMTLLTCFQKITLLKLLPIACIDGLFRCIFYLFKPKLFVAFLKALFWDITHAGLILKKRSEFSKIRKVKDKELFHLFSYKLFPEHRSPKLKLFWAVLDFFTRTYLRLVGIKTYDM
jgi:GT2 family glycosyltransferase